MILHLYHGCENHNHISDCDIVFFSTSEEFSKEYGIVNQYEIEISNYFNSCSKEHIELLLNSVGELLDSYDNSYYYSYDDLEESGLLYSDTWEIFELYINQIRHLGFDSMIIYEGGVENYILFYPKLQIKSCL